jgi:hypothetical protein
MTRAVETPKPLPKTPQTPSSSTTSRLGPSIRHKMYSAQPPGNMTTNPSWTPSNGVQQTGPTKPRRSKAALDKAHGPTAQPEPCLLRTHPSNHILQLLQHYNVQPHRTCTCTSCPLDMLPAILSLHPRCSRLVIHPHKGRHARFHVRFVRHSPKPYGRTQASCPEVGRCMGLP